MTKASDPEVVATLQKALEQVKESRLALDQQVEAVEKQRSKLTLRETLLTQTIAGFQDFDVQDASSSEEVAAAQNGHSQNGRFAISDEKLEKIRIYLARKGKVRQQDVAEHLNFNTGVVSLGLHKLQHLGLAEPVEGEKIRGSQAWVSTAVGSEVTGAAEGETPAAA